MKLSIFVHFLTYKNSNFMLVSLIKHGLLRHPFRDLQPVVTVSCSVALLCLVPQRSGKTDTWSFLFRCIILLSLEFTQYHARHSAGGACSVNQRSPTEAHRFVHFCVHSVSIDLIIAWETYPGIQTRGTNVGPQNCCSFPRQ